MGLSLGKVIERSTKNLGDKIKLPGGKTVKIPYGKTIKLPNGKKIKLPSKNKKNNSSSSGAPKNKTAAPAAKPPVNKNKNCLANNNNQALTNKHNRDKKSVRAANECPLAVTPEAVHAITKAVPELDVSNHIKDPAIHKSLLEEASSLLNSSFMPASVKSVLGAVTKATQANCINNDFSFGNGLNLKVSGFDINFKDGFGLPKLEFPKIDLKSLSKYFHILNIDWKSLLDKFPHIKLPDIHWPSIDWPDLDFKFWDSIPSFKMSWSPIDWDALKDAFPDVDWDALKVEMPKITWPEIVLKYPDLDWASFDYEWPDIDWAKLKASFPDVDWDKFKVDFPDIKWPNVMLKYPDFQWFESSWFDFPDIDWPSVDWPSVSLALPHIDWPKLNLDFPDVDWDRLKDAFPDVDWDDFKAKFPDITWPGIIPHFPDLDWPKFNMGFKHIKWPDLFRKLGKLDYKNLFKKLNIKLPKINWLKLLKKLPKLKLSDISQYFKDFKFPHISWKDLIKKFPKLDWMNLINKLPDIKWPQFILDHPEINWVAIVIGVVAIGSIAALMSGSHLTVKAVGAAMGAAAIGLLSCRKDKKDATSRMLTSAANALPGGVNKAKLLNKSGKLDAGEFHRLVNGDSTEMGNFINELKSGNVKKLGLDKTTAVNDPHTAEMTLTNVTDDHNLSKASNNNDLVKTANAVAVTKASDVTDVSEHKLLSGSQRLSIAAAVQKYNNSHKNKKGILAKTLKKKSTIKSAKKINTSIKKVVAKNGDRYKNLIADKIHNKGISKAVRKIKIPTLF